MRRGSSIVLTSDQNETGDGQRNSRSRGGSFTAFAKFEKDNEKAA